MMDSKGPLVLYLVSDVDRAIAFEWIAMEAIKWVDVRLSFLFIGSRVPSTYFVLEKIGMEVFFIEHNNNFQLPFSFLKILILLRKLKPFALHCHLRKANLLGLPATLLISKLIGIHTRHHSTFHHDCHPWGVVWDKIFTRLSHKVVSVSPGVSEILLSREGAPFSKVVEITHGFDLEMFRQVSPERVQRFLYSHSIPSEKKIIGVVSRFEDAKGVEYTINAYKNLLDDFSNVHLVMLNARGPAESRLIRDIANLPAHSFTMIPFYEDVAAAYAAMACLVHVPINPYCEAFGQVYVEALAAGVPSIFTLSGIASCFVKHEENALVVPYEDSGSILIALRRLLTDESLCRSLRISGQRSVDEKFKLVHMTTKLHCLYLSLAQIN